MKTPHILTFTAGALATFLTACATSAPAPGKSPYSGHGAKTVSEATLARFAAPALTPAVSEKVQNFLDIRSPGGGVLDPSGRKLFFTWNVTGSFQVWRLDSPKGFPIQMTGGEDRTDVADVTPDGKWLIISRDRNGEENPGLYLQSPKGGPLSEIQHKKGIQTQFEFVTDDSRWLYFRSNDIKPNSYAIYRYDLVTRKRELLFSRDGIWGVNDYRKDGTLLLQKETGALTREVYEWNPGTNELTPVIGQDEKEEYRVRYAARPGEFLVLTPKLGDFRRLYRFSLKDRKLLGVTPEMKHDITGFGIDHAKKHLVYLVNEDGYLRTHALDAGSLQPLRLPEFPGAVHVIPASMSRDGRNMNLGITKDKAPKANYSWNWQTRKLTEWVIPSAPEIDLDTFVPARLESYPARDGTPIPMFVRRPPQCQNSAQSAAAAAPCPVVVYFHGGPEGQSLPGFNIFAQLLVDAGFIFAEPNVRGSDGYGNRWFHADDGANRLKIITDIEDASLYIRKEWARNGIAPKVGILGGSYGGYSALIGMTMFAGAYDAGVSIVGISNLLTFLNNTAPYRRILRASEYGDPVKDHDVLIQLSPMTYLDRVKSPLMLIQGASDPRVPVGEAVQIHDALAARRIPSQLIIFPDEGHGSAKRRNQVLERGHMLEFFIKHLK